MFDKAISKFKSISNKPQVDLNYYSISNDFVRSTLKITHVNGSRENKQTLSTAIREKFNGTLIPVENSFRVLSSTPFTDTVVGVLSVVKPYIPLTEANKRGFRAFATNMYMDSERNIWSLKECASGKLLVQTNAIDDSEALDALLASNISSSYKYSNEYTATASASNSVIDSVSGGDLVTYVSDKRGDLMLGYVVATTLGNSQEKAIVLPHNSMDYESICTTLIIDRIDDSNIPKPEVKNMESVSAAAKANISIEDLLAYYKMVYSRSPDFFNEFEKRVRSHAFC